MAYDDHRAAAELPGTIADLLDVPPADIGPHDNLIELGMDSIAMMRLAGQWRKQGTRVRFADLAANPTLHAWRELLAGKEEASATVRSAEPSPDVPDVDESAPFSLALMQHAYWVGRTPGQRWGGVAAHFYNEFDGTNVDPVRLENAVRALVDRHGMLRVRILDDGDQQILPDSSWPGLRVHDLRAHSAEKALAALEETRGTLSHRSMDIAAAEVFDVQLSLLPDGIRTGGTRVHVNLDMVAADALSLRVLLADLARFYAESTETAASLDYSYPRYLADRARSRAAVATEIEADREYWRDRLPDLPEAPHLPVRDRESDTATVLRHHRWLSPAETRTLENLSHRHGLTTAMALASVFAETLAAWSSEPRFLLNLPLFDREPLHPEVGSLVGDFTSSVLLEWDGTKAGSFADRAMRLQERFHADAGHTGYSGVEVLRDASRLRGEQVLMPVVYTSALGLGELFPAEVRTCFGEAVWIISQGPQVYLDAQVTELDGGLLVNWDMRESAFLPGVPDAMFSAYTTLLERLLTDESAWSSTVPVLAPADQLRIREKANDTARPSDDRKLHAAFFETAERTPDANAVLWGEDGSLSYREVADRALRVAGFLRTRGAGSGDLVAVSLPKGPDQIVAVLGVLAAGAAYLPLGVDQPAARRERILTSAGVRLVLDDLSVTTTCEPLSGPMSDVDDDLAYVIYTSGSTGEPKGVEIPHSAAVNTIDDLNRRFDITATDRSLALSALEFDLSVYDVFGPLSVGGAVVCVREETRRDALAWTDLINRHRVTVLNCVPALLDMLLTAAEGGPALPLRTVLLGGDWVTVDLPPRLAERAPACRFVALGGTTETAIHSTVQEVDSVPDHWTAIPYGVPLSNVVCRVVNAMGRDCPDWVAGELWIGGAGVARGYRGDPNRTADRFVERNGMRWYRTGDRARYWADGTIEFLGRADHQVKIRGHRIELGEIEAALAAHPLVAHGVVVVTEERRLAAAVTIAGDESAPDPAALRDFLAERLPAAMVPEVFSVLESVPLTANGKVDRAALARTLAAVQVSVHSVLTPPVGPVEERVAAAWAEILRVPEVGREHDFFALGGDSLLATRLISRLRTDGLSGVVLSTLFAHPVLADFAATLTLGEVAEPVATLTADPLRRHEPFPPTDVQRAYWLGRGNDFTLGGIGCHFYREYDVLDLDPVRLEAAVNQLIGRHEMLRAIFDERGDQHILADVPRFTIPLVEADTEEAFADLREEMSHTVFDPAVWPLFAIRAVRVGNRTRLAVGMDNLVLDALSILIFYAELGALYENPATVLPSVEVSFRDYVLGATPTEEALKAARDYWADRLPTLPPAPRLPLAKDPAEVTRPRFSRRAARLDADRWKRIVDRARDHGMTPSAVLLTAFAEVLGRWSAQSDLTLNITLFDRREVHTDINNVLGDFTSLLLVAYEPESGDGWLNRARQVQEQLWRALDHRDVSTVWVLRELARISGDPEVTMPVVFTSALGVAADQQVGGNLFDEYVWGVSQTPQVWLDHQVTESEGGVNLHWDAIDELFPAGVLDEMFEAYVSLVSWLAATEWSKPVPDLLPDNQHAIRALVNGTDGEISTVGLHENFFDQATNHPDRPAIQWDEGDHMSYGELSDRALRLASVLRAQNVQPGEPVAVTLPKGPDQIVAVLGVLAAGAAYVPAGIGQPPARRDRIHRLAGVRFAITDESHHEVVAAAGADPIVLSQALKAEPATTFVRPDPNDLAYVIFTSGSTGDPKGVEITHQAAMNTIADLNERYAITHDDRVLAVSALDFDLSVYDVFGPLSAGGAVVTIEEDARRDARRWLDLVNIHKVTVWNTVPALLEMLLVVAEHADPPSSLRLVLVSGDWVGLDLPGRLTSACPDCRFVSLGGATEASIWSNYHEVEKIDPSWRSIPYGRPLRNQRFRVVDTLDRDCPTWVAGELWIGGTGVARGYRGAPELTAERFVRTDDGIRWYRTGDLGRYWPDGTLEFLGRADQQVKVRGHRIELGEIEAALLSSPAVAYAAAAVAKDRVTGARLVSAVVPTNSETELSTEEIRKQIADRLPEHMIPDHIAVLPTLPLSANGKVDRAAISALLAPTDTQELTEGPRGNQEKAVAALWSELLEQEVIGRNDNFFTLGGDSLLATRLIESVRVNLGVALPLRQFFTAPTIAAIAAFVDAQAAVAEDMEEGVL